MVKKDLIKALYEAHGGMTYAETAALVDHLLTCAREGMWSDGGLSIPGFGAFRAKPKPGRKVRLPNGSIHRSRDGVKMRFLPSGKLKAMVNDKTPVEENL